MSTLSADERAKLIQASRPAAAAFLEDMDYIRGTIRRTNTSRGELRRLSAVLRRFLLDGDILKLASPRVGRIAVPAPDIKPFYDAERVLWFPFFASGGATVFGVRLQALSMMNAGPASKQPAQQAEMTLRPILERYDPDRMVALRLHNFLKQRVLCYMRQWASRGDVIRYVANVASGVHSGAAATPQEALLERMRHSCSYSVRDGKVEIHVLPELRSDSFKTTAMPEGGELPFSFRPAAIDPVLIEVLATAQFLASSTDITRLENVLREEVN